MTPYFLVLKEASAGSNDSLLESIRADNDNRLGVTTALSVRRHWKDSSLQVVKSFAPPGERTGDLSGIADVLRQEWVGSQAKDQGGGIEAFGDNGKVRYFARPSQAQSSAGASWTQPTYGDGTALTHTDAAAGIENLFARGWVRTNGNNPSNGNTIELGGTTITFVSSSPTGNQVLIGGSAGATLNNLRDFLNETAAFGVYAFVDVDRCRMMHRTPGGNTYGIVVSGVSGWTRSGETMDGAIAGHGVSTAEFIAEICGMHIAVVGGGINVERFPYSDGASATARSQYRYDNPADPGMLIEGTPLGGTWNADGANAFTASGVLRSNTGRFCRDPGFAADAATPWYEASDGNDMVELASVASKTACNSTPDSWFAESGLASGNPLTVHISGGASPANRVVQGRFGMRPFSPRDHAFNIDVYGEQIRLSHHVEKYQQASFRKGRLARRQKRKWSGAPGAFIWLAFTATDAVADLSDILIEDYDVVRAANGFYWRPAAGGDATLGKTRRVTVRRMKSSYFGGVIAAEGNQNDGHCFAAEDGFNDGSTFEDCEAHVGQGPVNFYSCSACPQYNLTVTNMTITGGVPEFFSAAQIDSPSSCVGFHLAGSNNMHGDRTGFQGSNISVDGAPEFAEGLEWWIGFRSHWEAVLHGTSAQWKDLCPFLDGGEIKNVRRAVMHSSRTGGDDNPNVRGQWRMRNFILDRRGATYLYEYNSDNSTSLVDIDSTNTVIVNAAATAFRLGSTDRTLADFQALTPQHADANWFQGVTRQDE